MLTSASDPLRTLNAASLDGFLAGQGERIDWLRYSDESAAHALSHVTQRPLSGRTSQRANPGGPFLRIEARVTGQMLVHLHERAYKRLVIA